MYNQQWQFDETAMQIVLLSKIFSLKILFSAIFISLCLYLHEFKHLF